MITPNQGPESGSSRYLSGKTCRVFFIINVFCVFDEAVDIFIRSSQGCDAVDNILTGVFHLSNSKCGHQVNSIRLAFYK